MALLAMYNFTPGAWICTVKSNICPENKIRSKPHNITMRVNERDDEIISCMCHDCAASAGGCKHAVNTYKMVL